MKRYYSFRVVTYADKEEFEELLKAGKKWEYICHDKDKTEKGENKDKHYHINIIFEQWKSIQAVCKMVRSEQNTFAIPMLDKEQAHRYLTHKDNPEKHQYKDEEIISNFKYKEEENKNEIEEFILTLENRQLTLREKAIKLGKDYIKNRMKYEQFVEDMLSEEEDIERGYRRGITLSTYEEFLADVQIALHPKRAKQLRIT